MARPQVFSLHTASWQWREHTADVEGAVPFPRYGHAACAVGDRYVAPLACIPLVFRQLPVLNRAKPFDSLEIAVVKRGAGLPGDTSTAASDCIRAPRLSR